MFPHYQANSKSFTGCHEMSKSHSVISCWKDSGLGNQRESFTVSWSRKVWQLQMGRSRFEIGWTCWITSGNSLHPSVSSFGKWGISSNYLDLWISPSPVLGYLSLQWDFGIWDIMDPRVKKMHISQNRKEILKRKCHQKQNSWIHKTITTFITPIWDLKNKYPMDHCVLF